MIQLCVTGILAPWMVIRKGKLLIPGQTLGCVQSKLAYHRIVEYNQALYVKYDRYYSGTSLLGTHWDIDFSPYYRGSLNLEVIQYTTVLHWDTDLE